MGAFRNVVWYSINSLIGVILIIIRFTALLAFLKALFTSLALVSTHYFCDDENDDGRNDDDDPSDDIAGVHGLIALIFVAAALESIITFNRAVFDRAQVTRCLIEFAI